MDIKLHKKKATEAFMKIKINETDYQFKVDKKIKEYRKKAQIKGFRPGKVPIGLVKKLYGASILMDEVNHLLSHKIPDYIKEHDLKLVGDPIPYSDSSNDIDWNNQKEFEFDYKLGLVDDFKVDITSEQNITRHEVVIDDKAVEETLKDIQEQHAKIEHPESSQEGDTILGELKEIEGGFSNKGSLNLDDILKKEVSKFIGLKVDDVIKFSPGKVLVETASLMPLFGQHEPEHKNKEFEFKITLINRSKPAELNQDLFDKIFGEELVKDIETFKENTKKTLEKNYKSYSENLLNKNIRDHLIQITNISLPDEFLKEWLLLTNEKLTKEDIEKEYYLYDKDLRWDLIANKISEEGKIEVGKEEVIERTKNMIRQQLGRGSSTLPDELESNINSFADNYLKEENGNNYKKIYLELRNEKIFDFIKESINISVKKVKIEEFKNML